MRLKLILLSPAEVSLRGDQVLAYIYRFEAFEEK